MKNTPISVGQRKTQRRMIMLNGIQHTGKNRNDHKNQQLLNYCRHPQHGFHVKRIFESLHKTRGEKNGNMGGI